MGRSRELAGTQFSLLVGFGESPERDLAGKLLIDLLFGDYALDKPKSKSH